MEAAATTANTIEWFNRLIGLAQWDKRLPFFIARLAREPEKYQQALLQMRSAIQKTPAQPPPSPAGGLANDDEWRRLYQKVVGASLLRETFGSEQDPFAGASADQLQLLAEVSDVAPDSRTMVYSRNGSFLAVLDAVRQSADLNTQEQIFDGLNKFLFLRDTDSAVADMLHDLAKSDEWFVVLASLRDGRDYTQDEPETVKETLRNWNQKLSAKLREILFNPTQLSRVPKKLVLLAWDKRALFDAKRAEIPAGKRADVPGEERKQVTTAVLAYLEKESATTLDAIEEDLTLLATVAKHYLDVRKFTKLDGLVYGWPKIARLGMANYSNLGDVEDYLVKGKAKPSDAELKAKDAAELFELCESNRDLIGFLRLRPYFREIDESDLRRYRPLAPVVVTDTPQAAGTPSPGAIPHAQTMQQNAPNLGKPAVRKSLLTITRKSTEPVGDGQQSLNYELAFVVPDKQEIKRTVTVSIRALLRKILSTLGATSEESLQPLLKDFSARSTPLEPLLASAGNVLRADLLSSIQQEYEALFQDQQPVRLFAISSDPELQFLPWEWLPRPGSADILISNQKYSVVRCPSSNAEPSIRPFKAPIGLMSVLPTAPGLVRLNIESTRKALEGLASSESVDYHALVQNKATIENLKSRLESDRPSIVHFEGYVRFLTDETPWDETFRVFLTSPHQEAEYEGISIQEFARILRTAGVQLLVVGQNGSEKVWGNPGPVMGALLVKAGVPAVLVPVRALDDATATAFITEFYRALLRGNSLEDALFTARHTLESKGGDWSAFALFARPSFLDALPVFLPPT